MRVRKIAAAVAVATAATAGGVAVAPSAQAATYKCTSTSLFYSDYSTRPTYGTNTQNTNCTLRYGDSGPGVAALQKAANLCYHQGLKVDGLYGPATRQAVINIQNFHKYYGAYVPVDGIFGPYTSAAMEWPAGGVWCW